MDVNKVSELLQHYVQIAEMVVSWRQGNMTAEVCLEQISYIITQPVVDSNGKDL